MQELHEQMFLTVNEGILVNTGHISVLKSRHLVTKACVFAIQSVDKYYCYP